MSYEPKDMAGLVPDHLQGGLHRYITMGVPPGHFLTAVLCNDLKEAFARADNESRDGLFSLVSYLYNHAPGTCWGSPAKYDAWMADKRLEQMGCRCGCPGPGGEGVCSVEAGGQPPEVCECRCHEQTPGGKD